MGSFEIYFTPLFTFSLPGTMRVTPSLPRRGRQPMRGISSPLFFRVFHRYSEAVALFGDARSVGAEARYTGSSKGDRLFHFLDFNNAKNRYLVLVHSFLDKNFDIKKPKILKDRESH
jgi:hypothetical protein